MGVLSVPPAVAAGQNSVPKFQGRKVIHPLSAAPHTGVRKNDFEEVALALGRQDSGIAGISPGNAEYS